MSGSIYEEQGLCRPECGSWKALPDSTMMVLDVLGKFLSAANLLVGIVTIILAVIQSHKLYVVIINRRWLPLSRCSIMTIKFYFVIIIRVNILLPQFELSPNCGVSYSNINH